MEFWDRVAYYREHGLDPLKWVAGCAVKVDLVDVVYPALRKIKPELHKVGVMVMPREDCDIFPCTGEDPVIERQVYDVDDPQVDLEGLRRLAPDRAISLIQVHQRRAESPDAFGSALMSVYKKIGEANIRFTVGKGHSIITSYEDAQFALFDFIKEPKGTPGGYTLANNDTIQIIDPTDDPGSEAQTFVGVSNSLNDLLSLGCHENIRMYPVYDSPNEEISGQISGHMATFASQHGMTLYDNGPLNKGKLLIGATFIGDSYRETPTFYDKLTEGMRIMVSRPFGDLAPVNVYLSCLADEDYLDKLKEEGLDLEDVRKAKEEIISVMKRPNIKIGELINQHCPRYGESFNADEHVVCTGDVSGPGILILQEIAQLGKVDMRLDRIPLNYPEYVAFATRHFLLDNGTAGTNGAVAMIGGKDVIDHMFGKLKEAGYNPQIIGSILGKGEGKCIVGPEVREMIASKGQLGELTIEER